MCGIVGAIANRDVSQLLMQGLEQLEYRGYDSAGIAVLNAQPTIECLRVVGKVSALANALTNYNMSGQVGIGHTRWATHGEPSEINAHPHTSNESIAVVHNGIIENHAELKTKLEQTGYTFCSDTDTEVIAHLIHYHSQQQNDLLSAIRQTVKELQGAFSLGIIAKAEPHKLFTVRHGSPVVIGLGANENFIASDQVALLNRVEKFIFLEEGDVAELTNDSIYIEDSKGHEIKRAIHQTQLDRSGTSKGDYPHYMLKEIYEQPQALNSTLAWYLHENRLINTLFSKQHLSLLKKVKRVRIIACGTSFHAGLVAADWIESLAKLPCHVEIASEYRYRSSVVEADTLLVAISQSGETADTLAALRCAQSQNYLATLAICNAPHSSLAREADLVLLTQAGVEIGVAATKTFTAQLTSLLLLSLLFSELHQQSTDTLAELLTDIKKLPDVVTATLQLDAQIQTVSQRFAQQQNALFLGRGRFFPIALEGALKLKEISYIHAEAYPAGELKHGPLALVDNQMPIVVLAPRDSLIEKLQSNVQEIKARNGQLYIFSDASIQWDIHPNVTVVNMPTINEWLAPIAYTVPLQLLAYHTAVLKETDVDQPRNLAKSVTVE